MSLKDCKALKIKARHIINWWPWPRSTSPARQWHEPAFLPAMWRLIPEEQAPTEYEMRLAKMAIASGLTLDGYRDPEFVDAVRQEMKENEMIARMGPIRHFIPVGATDEQLRWRDEKLKRYRRPGPTFADLYLGRWEE